MGSGYGRFRAVFAGAVLRRAASDRGQTIEERRIAPGKFAEFRVSGGGETPVQLVSGAQDEIDDFRAKSEFPRSRQIENILCLVGQFVNGQSAQKSGQTLDGMERAEYRVQCV